MNPVKKKMDTLEYLLKKATHQNDIIGLKRAINEVNELLIEIEQYLASKDKEIAELNRQVSNWQLLHDLVKQENERKGKRLYELLNPLI